MGDQEKCGRAKGRVSYQAGYQCRRETLYVQALCICVWMRFHAV